MTRENSILSLQPHPSIMIANLDERRAAALHRATTALKTAATLIPELESLSESLSVANRAQNRYATGLPRLIKSTRLPAKVIEQTIKDLGEVDETGILEIEKRLQGSCPEVELVEQRWAILKRCRKLVHLQRPIDIPLKPKRRAVVDVVDGGYEWIHIRLNAATLSRVTRAMTETGWDWGEHERGDVVDPEEWEDCPLATTVRMMCDAAKLNRKEYIIPRIRVVLSKLNREDDKDIAIFLEQLERMDPDVEINIDDLSSEFLKSEPPDIETAISNLASKDDPMDDLTPILNLDNTVIIDFISDITHTKIEAQDWQAEATRAMIKHEESTEGGAMAKRLYSVLSGKKLVCTKTAADHVGKVLETVGTTTERERGRLLVPWTLEDQGLPAEERRARFCDLSIYPPPPNVQLPITVLHTDWNRPGAVSDAISAGLLPPVAEAVADGHENRWLDKRLSTFMHGWSTGDVTVTSERERPKIIKRVIEENRNNMEEKGPKIYELGLTRNLLSKNAKPPEDWDTNHEPHKGT